MGCCKAISAAGKPWHKRRLMMIAVKIGILFWGNWMNQDIKTELEAAAFRRLLDHLRQHTEAQNIDLMIAGDFCRNCLAKWYAAAAEERGVAMDYEQARETIYGMPYGEWKSRYQLEATPEQMAVYDAKQKLKGKS